MCAGQRPCGAVPPTFETCGCTRGHRCSLFVVCWPPLNDHYKDDDNNNKQHPGVCARSHCTASRSVVVVLMVLMVVQSHIALQPLSIDDKYEEKAREKRREP